MTMTTEERKIYNEKYYAENKKRIAALLLTKIECPLCSKFISKSNLERHKIGHSCSKNQSTRSNELLEIREQIERLTNELKELKSKPTEILI